MNIGYIDSSFLLSIIFEDDEYERSCDCWNTLDILFSSTLLEIETRINVHKYCTLSKKHQKLYGTKERELTLLLENITRKNIDREIILEIKNNETLNGMEYD